MQEWYNPARHAVYENLLRTVPHASLRLASLAAIAAGIIWLSVFIGSSRKKLRRAFITFHGPGNWFVEDGHQTVWGFDIVTSIGSFSTLIKGMLAFLLLFFVRQKIFWYEQLKTKIWTVKRDVELASFITAIFLAGDDEPLQRARHDIHRWLTAAHFYNLQALSIHLQQYDVSDLLDAGLLTIDEYYILEAEVAQDQERRSSSESLPTRKISKKDGRMSKSLSEFHWAASSTSYKRYSAASSEQSRDLILWWLEIRITVAKKEKLLMKEGFKKTIKAIWAVRDSMSDLLLESTRRQMPIWVVLMQLMVDVYVILLPFAAIHENYYPHIWTMPFPMFNTFIVTFFYDSMLQIASIISDPFDVHVDSLFMDPVLVSTERATFWNLGMSCDGHLPEPLRTTWDNVKHLKEKDDKGSDDEEKKENKEKQMKK